MLKPNCTYVLQGAAVAASVCAILQQRQSNPPKFAAPEKQEEMFLSGTESDADNCKNRIRYGLLDPGSAQCTSSHDADPADVSKLPGSVVPLNANSEPSWDEDKLKGKHDESMPEGGARTAEHSQAHEDCVSLAAEDANDEAQNRKGLQFAILFSAYVPAACEPQSLLRDIDVLQMPSLHFFAQSHSNKAWQIPASESLAVQNWFQSHRQIVLRSSRGHAVPGDRPSISSYKSFIKQFVSK